MLWKQISKQVSTIMFSRGLSTSTKIGIIGCGNVGNAVGHNIVRNGRSIAAVFDTEKSKMEAMPKGSKLCSTPREVAEMSDIVITGLPRPPNVKAATEGPDGILSGLSKGKIWIDHSTTDYEQTLTFVEQIKDIGAHFLEAPITGGYEALKKGQMAVYVGGDKTVMDRVKPLLDMSYAESYYVGETVGAAMIIKVVSNMLCCVNVLAMAESLMLAKRANIDLKTFWNAIRLGAGNSFAWETAAPVVFQGNYDPNFTMELMCKDLQLGYDLARKFKVPMEIHQMTLGIHRRAQYRYGDSAGCYIPPKLYEDELGESLQRPGFEDWTYDNDFNKGSLTTTHNNIK